MCTEFNSIIGQIVRQVKTASPAAYMMEYKQAIFLLLIWNANQQMLTDAAYECVVR